MESISPLDFLDADPRPTCVVDSRKSASDAEPHIELSNTALRKQAHLLDAVRGDDDDHTGVKARLRAWIVGESEGAPESIVVEGIDGYRLFGYTVKRRWKVIQWQEADRTVGLPIGNGGYISVGEGASNGGHGALSKGKPSEPSIYESTVSEELDPIRLIRGLSGLFEGSVGCREMGAFWTELVVALMSPGHGCLFAFVYSLQHQRKSTDSPALGWTSKHQLAAAQGCQAAGLTLPEEMNIATGKTRFASACRTAQARVEPLNLDEEELGSLHIGGSPYGHSGEYSAYARAVLCPILVRGAKVATGFLVLGIRPSVASGQLSRAWLECITKFTSERMQAIMNAEEATTATDEHESKSKVLEDALADRNDVTEKLASTLTMMEMVDVGIFDYNTEGVLLHANESFYKLSGHPKGPAAKSYSWADCVFPEDKDLTFSHWTLLSQGTATTFEMRWKRPAESTFDGAEDTEGQWVLAACVPTKNESGEVISVSGCITDIAAQKRSQSDALKRAEALERAQASEKRFSRFAEAAPIGIYIVDLEGKMQYCNRGWFEITGHPVVEDYAQIDWSSVLSDQGNTMTEAQWDLMVNHKQSVNYQFQLRRAWSNGHDAQGQMWALASAYPELSADGTVTAVAGTLTDISQLKWAESMQKQRIDEAIEAKRQQDNFIDMTSHEIRNPLGAVIHCADLILSTLTEMADLLGGNTTFLPPRQRTQFDELREGALEAVNTIISCSGHQKRIVDDILTLSKLDSRLLTIVPSPVRIDDVLRDAANMFDVDAKKVDVELRVVREQSLGTLAVDWVMLDTGRLMQVLINLITNALKFTQKEAVRVVTLSMGASRSRLSEQELDVEFVPVHTLRERGNAGADWGTGEEVCLYFRVSDTGCGFSTEQKVMIFERFAQASPRTHSRYGGSGLGLFITRELIEMQGGEIGVSSRPGDGAAFAFYITARSVVAPGPDSSSVRPRKSSKQLGSKPAKAGYTILVVEDNLVNQKVLRKQLEKLGHIVHVVSHGGEALKLLKSTACWKGNGASPLALDVVLMDIEMPIMDGFTCTRKIREAQAQGNIKGHLPVIAVSANARREQISHALECGMDDTISKPFRIVDLIPKMDRLVAG
ncbi:hypothetical protein LTR85_007664 [Meristemomyces frigidus]|nr:hypothetical protein LTR85_007664 [Meristemomyces frigidus]